MKIVVGLGNIGEKYAKNRHNAGFIFVDHFARLIAETNWKLYKNLELAGIQDQNIFLAKPTTLMNNSGRAVSKLLHYFKTSPKDLIVIYDDIDLPLGAIRIREKGSAGTHNGMRSIIEALGTGEFSRIRIGIENRNEMEKTHRELSDYVLSDFRKDEWPSFEKALSEGTEKLKKLALEK